MHEIACLTISKLIVIGHCKTDSTLKIANKMVKTSTDWLAQFPNESLKLRNGKLWCQCCNKEVSSEKKDSIAKHVATKKHKDLIRIGATNMTLTNTGEIDGKSSQWEDLVKALIAARLPIHCLGRKSLRNWMQKYVRNGQNLPSITSCRRKVDSLSQADIETTIKICKNKDLCFTLDETSDAKGRKVLHVLCNPLESGLKPRLLVSKFLDKCDAAAIVQNVMDALNLLGSRLDQLVVLTSDSAPYMIAAGKKLSVIFPRMLHSTCWAHILHLAAEEIQASMPLANALIVGMKQALLKCRSREQEYFASMELKGFKQKKPPVPVLTRWGTWMKAGHFHFTHISAIMHWVETSKDQGAVLKKMKLLFSQSADALAQELERIHQIYPGLEKILNDLEGTEVMSCTVWTKLEVMLEYLKSLGVPSEKLELYMKEKHPARDFWEQAQFLDPRLCTADAQELPPSLQIFSSHQVPTTEIIAYKVIRQAHLKSGAVFPADQFWKNFSKEMPILSGLALQALSVLPSSAAVERSFSTLTDVLSPKRTNFTEENLSAHVRVTFNYAMDEENCYESDEENSESDS